MCMQVRLLLYGYIKCTVWFNVIAPKRYLLRKDMHLLVRFVTEVFMGEPPALRQ